MKSLLVAFTFLLVFTVSLTPAAMAAPDYPPTPSDSEDTNPGKNPVDNSHDVYFLTITFNIIFIV